MTPIDRNAIILARGRHNEVCDDSERCLFEWFNWITRQQHTDDRPDGVSPVLYRMGIRLNDFLDDTKRQVLTRYLPNGTSPLAGTEHDGLDETRAWMAANWSVRVALPMWLDVAGLAERATQLRGLAPIVDRDTSIAAQPLVRAIRDEAGKRRRQWRDELRTKIAERLRDKPAAAAAVSAVAASDAAADAVAAAVAATAADAAAIAAADAAAIAAAAADAAAIAAAAADAAAVADAAAAAVADAVAAADADRHWAIRSKVYKAVYVDLRARYGERFRPTIDQLHDSAIALYAAMMKPTLK